MRKDLIIIKVTPLTPEWYEARRREGIGASEMATVLGLNDYQSSIRLFYEKVGLVPPRIEDNEFTFHGRNQEEYVSTCWESWDGTDYIENWKAGTKIRRCRRINGMIKRPEPGFEWVFCSPDRLINQNQRMIDENNQFTDQLNEEEGNLEVKQISRFATYKWANGVPIYYIVQVHTQMIVLGLPYSEMVLLEDGRHLRVIRISPDEELINRIMTEGQAFWNNVLEGRKYFKAMLAAKTEKDREVWMAKLHSIEPGPDGTDDYTEFLSEAFKKERKFVKGDEQDYSNAFYHKLLGKIIKGAKTLQKQYEDLLKQRCFKDETDYIDFGDEGRIKYFLKKGNENYQLDNQIKVEFNEEAITENLKEQMDIKD